MEAPVIKEHNGGIKTCNFCHAEEGKLRPIGRFKVKLKTVEVLGTEKRACQSCSRKHHQIQQSVKEVTEVEMKDEGLLHLKKFVALIVHACFILVMLSVVATAQPPGMPSDPQQAPIDGGLSLLAAAGGAYAVKKLRDKKAD